MKSVCCDIVVMWYYICLLQVVWESCSSMFKKGMKLEVVDKMRISQVNK